MANGLMMHCKAEKRAIFVIVVVFVFLLLLVMLIYTINFLFLYSNFENALFFMNISFFSVKNNGIIAKSIVYRIKNAFNTQVKGVFNLQYLITFLEGIISFISPCMLPMLPIYLSYFAGNADKKQHILSRALAFVIGFTVIFTGLGLFAGTLSGFLIRYQQAFGLSFLDIFRLPFFKGIQGTTKISGLFSAFVFGMIYSVSLTPCVGAFLGSALMLAGTSGGALKGALLLLTYSLGLGIPFLISAVLIDRLNTVFTFIKQHYKIVNLVSGLFLIVTGIFMMFGIMNRLLAFFS